jgi:alkyldihydroxyacetonephosphate synthase
VLVLGVESAVHPAESRLAELVALAADHGGTASAGGGGKDTGGAGQGDTAAETWRSAFLRMPYVRDGLARMSAIVETFETACTWDRAPELYETVRTEIGAAVASVTGAPGLVNCRFTHVYPDGPAPYFSVIAAGRPGSEVAMWDDVKTAATEVLGRLGATITHHHAVGRDHRPGYDRQRPEPFAVALRAAKAALDPAGVLNPGVLVDPV